jgi:uncharacterized radical SAM superfamily Fe-S cluster-containing enzyme
MYVMQNYDRVVTPDKKLIPFCLFNITSMDGKPLYREKALSKN